MDFKSALPGLGDKDKSEFLKDVCALANSDGGDLVYGISEKAGKASELTPVQGETADATKRRLGQVLDAGLEPRVVGLQFVDVAVSGGGYVLIVRVPASFNGPHRYIVNNIGRFAMRNGTHTTELTYGQLRAAFDRTATLTERARRFRDDRIAAIENRRTWKPIVKGPICIAHLIPIAAMAGNRSIDIHALYYDYTKFIFSGWGGGSRSTNLDGLVVHPGLQAEQSEVAAYTQIFRSGVLEAVRAGGSLSDPDCKAIPSTTVSAFYREAMQKFLDASRVFGLAGPAIVGVSLLNVAGYEFALPREHFGQRPKTDRADLVLPETWLDDIESVTNVDKVARPLLDMLWQSFDVERCYLYDENGQWAPR